jgi:hypothetical protein
VQWAGTSRRLRLGQREEFAKGNIGGDTPSSFQGHLKWVADAYLLVPLDASVNAATEQKHPKTEHVNTSLGGCFEELPVDAFAEGHP